MIKNADSISRKEINMQDGENCCQLYSRQTVLNVGIKMIEELIVLAKSQEEKIAYQKQLCFLMMKLKMNPLGKGSSL